MPINTSRLADTALATAVGFKHLKNQAESNLLSAENNLSTNKVQEAQATMNYNEAVIRHNEAEVDRPSNLIEGEISKNDNDQNELQKKIDSFNDKYDPEKGGTGIPSRQAQAWQEKRMNNLEALKKSRAALELEQQARVVMRNDVGARFSQLDEAKARTQRADEYLAKVQKETSWLVGGKK